ncbi:UMP-CMP kinase [Gautieria morchelliformis]|nr:UMP-CMP kinase [Gautieria morchelliformis]
MTPNIEKVAQTLQLHNETAGQTTNPASTESKFVFDHNKVTVIFVLGGPGAGKGTQCSRLVQDYAFVHLSAGDLLRAEQHREGSQYGDMIRTCIREGTIVPMEVTQRQNDAWASGKGRFLIDGFPRKLDQAAKFEEEVCIPSLVLFFSCTEEIMLQRLLERGKTSGREDDNTESIKKRFVTYKEQTRPVIDHYTDSKKVAEVDGTRGVDEVYFQTAKAVESVLLGRQ